MKHLNKKYLAIFGLVLGSSLLAQTKIPIEGSSTSTSVATTADPVKISGTLGQTAIETKKGQYTILHEGMYHYINLSTPQISINQSINSFSTTTNKVSAVQTFSVLGTNLRTVLAVTVPTDYEISTSATGTYFSTLNLSPKDNTVSQAVYIRLKSSATAKTIPVGTVSISNADAVKQTFTIPAGSISQAGTPIIAVSGNLVAFSTVSNTVSSAQSFTVSGTDLSAALVINAPTDYEISETTNGTFTSSVSITPVSKIVSTKTIYIRLKSSPVAKNIAISTITITSTGAASQSKNIPASTITSSAIAKVKLPVLLSTASDSIYVNLSSNTVATSPAPVVTLWSKKITEDKWSSQALTKNNDGQYLQLINTSDVGEIGLQYYLSVNYNGGKIEKTDTTAMYFTSKDLSIPVLLKGTTLAAYQIISIPNDLGTNISINSYMGALGDQAPNKWRLFRYNPTTGKNEEFPKDFTIFDNGKAYWLISKEGGTLAPFSNETHKVTDKNPFKLDLQKGWNLIGTPYNFKLSWAEIATANGLTGTYKTFTNGNFEATDILKPFSGGFVFVDNDKKISFPTLKNASINQRLGEETAVARTEVNSDNDWSMNMIVSQKELKNNFVGIGMNAAADSLYDQFDEMALPQMQSYLEFNTHHASYFHPRFSKDVKPSAENSVWDFNFSSSNSSEPVNIAWESPKDLSSDLYMIDHKNEKVINLKNQSTYTFIPSGASQNFRFVKGDENFVNTTLDFSSSKVLSVSPNPSSDFTIVDYFVANENGSNVEIVIKNTNGTILKQSNQFALKGIASQKLTISDLSTGIYFVEVQIDSKNSVYKLIKN